MAQQVASYVVRPSILRAASLAGYEHRRRVFCLKQGRAAARISPGRCSQHRFDSMAWSRVQLPGKKMGEREPDLYRFLGWIFDHSRGIFGEKKKEKLFVIFYVAILLINKYYYYNSNCWSRKIHDRFLLKFWYFISQMIRKYIINRLILINNDIKIFEKLNVVLTISNEKQDQLKFLDS